MKSTVLLLCLCLLFFSCKRDAPLETTSNPVKGQLISFDKKIDLINYSKYTPNSVVAVNSKFLVMNTNWRWKDKYFSFYLSHTWYDEFLNEDYNFESINAMSYESMVRESNGAAYYYSFRSYPLSWLNNNTSMNISSIYKIRDKDFSKDLIFQRSDTVLNVLDFDFFKITKKGSIIFHLMDTLFCVDTLGQIRWKTASKPLNLLTLNDLVETNSGDILLLGTKQIASTNKDIAITCISNTGNIKWQKLYGGKYDDDAKEILINKEQQIYLIGQSNSYSKSQDQDALIIQVNAAGDTIQQKTFGGVFYDAFETGLFYKDKLVLSGYHNPNNSGTEGVFLTLLDLNLNILQQIDAPNTAYDHAGSCALIGNSMAVCGGGFLLRFHLPK